MIKSFADKRTAALFIGLFVKRVDRRVAQRAYERLMQLDAVTAVEQMNVPPGNKLEKLRGDHAGFWSVRVNDQWRLTFHFVDGNAYDVALVDYH